MRDLSTLRNKLRMEESGEMHDGTKFIRFNRDFSMVLAEGQLSLLWLRMIRHHVHSESEVFFFSYYLLCKLLGGDIPSVCAACEIFLRRM